VVLIEWTKSGPRFLTRHNRTRSEDCGRVNSVAYYALVPHNQSLQAGTDTSDAGWFRVTDLPPLALIIARSWNTPTSAFETSSTNTNVGFELLLDKLTLTDLQLVHEAILGENLDKRNFRRKIIQAANRSRIAALSIQAVGVK
jgi:hypothetical protein